jgi:hypothetical protein
VESPPVEKKRVSRFQVLMCMSRASLGKRSVIIVQNDAQKTFPHRSREMRRARLPTDPSVGRPTARGSERQRGPTRDQRPAGKCCGSAARRGPAQPRRQRSQSVSGHAGSGQPVAVCCCCCCCLLAQEGTKQALWADACARYLIEEMVDAMLANERAIWIVLSAEEIHHVKDRTGPDLLALAALARLGPAADVLAAAGVNTGVRGLGRRENWWRWRWI